jgi:hypothetical protein
MKLLRVKIHNRVLADYSHSAYNASVDKRVLENGDWDELWVDRVALLLRFIT